MRGWWGMRVQKDSLRTAALSIKVQGIPAHGAY